MLSDMAKRNELYEAIQTWFFRLRWMGALKLLHREITPAPLYTCKFYYKSAVLSMAPDVRRTL